VFLFKAVIIFFIYMLIPSFSNNNKKKIENAKVEKLKKI